MNLNQLHSGSDYAHSRWRGNDKYVENAERIRVVRTFSRVETGNDQSTNYAEVLHMHADGEDYVDGPGTTKEVRARDIFMRWDEYEAERDFKAREKRKQQEAAEQKMQERNERKQRLIDGLKEKGFNDARITIYYVQLDRKEVERWLGIEPSTL